MDFCLVSKTHQNQDILGCVMVKQAQSLDHTNNSDISEVFTIHNEVEHLQLAKGLENDATAFSAKCVACVVKIEERIDRMLHSFHRLGFEAACTDSLSEAFEIVSEDPEDWALVVLVLDQKYSKLEISKWVRLIRLMRHQIPIMLVSEGGPAGNNSQEPTQLGDCFVRLPLNVLELDECIGLARKASQAYGLNFSHFKSNSLPKQSRFAAINA